MDGSRVGAPVSDTGEDALVVEGWAYEGWGGTSTIEITVGHCYAGMVPVTATIRRRVATVDRCGDEGGPN